jgi:hypothetical protein
MPTTNDDTTMENIIRAEALADEKKMKVTFYDWDRGRNMMVEEA